MYSIQPQDRMFISGTPLQVIEGITEKLGSNIWNNAFIGFTHGKLSSLPDGLTYGELALGVC